MDIKTKKQKAQDLREQIYKIFENAKDKQELENFSFLWFDKDFHNYDIKDKPKIEEIEDNE